MAAKKRTKARSSSGPKKKASARARGKRGLNAEEYVRTVAQKSNAGCGVCCYPNVAKKLEEISTQMDAQRVKIPAAQLLRDLKKHYEGFSCSDERFRKHIRECMEREL